MSPESPESRSVVNDKSSLIVEKITNDLLTKNEAGFYNLLHSPGVTYDETTQSYIVDLSNAQFQTHATN